MSKSIASYLPAGTRVVLRGTSKKVAQQWYVTQSDINLPEEPVVGVCPIRTNNSEIRTHEQDGVQVWFLEGQIRVRISASQVAAAKNLRLQLFQYDVHGGNCDPSQAMWRFGCRTSESVWAVPCGAIPLRYLDELTELGVTWHNLEVSPESAGAVLDSCIRSIQRELRDSVAAAQTVANNAITAMQAAQQDQDAQEAAIRTRELNRAKALQKRLGERLERYQASISKLGIADLGFRFDAVRTTVAAISTGMAERARQFVKTLNALQQAQATDTSIANTEVLETMPPEVLADYAQDHGLDAQAEALRESFTENTPTDDDTFSLADAADEQDECPAPAPVPASYSPAVGDNVIVARGRKVPVGTVGRVLMLRDGDYGMSAMIGYGTYNPSTRRWAQTQWLPAKNLDRQAA